MITLIRLVRLCQLKIKIKLAFYMFLDRQLKNFNSDEFMNKVMKEIAPHIASLVHDEVIKQKETNHGKSKS